MLAILLCLSMVLSLYGFTFEDEDSWNDDVSAFAEHSAEGMDMQSFDEVLESETAPMVTEAPVETEAPAETEQPVEIDETVAAVQAMIDALPSLEEVQAMDRDAQGEIYLQMQAAYDAYMALTEEQQALVSGTEIFEALFEFFNAQIMHLYSGGDGTLNDPYQISTPAELRTLADAVNNDSSVMGMSGKFFILTADINLNNEPWTPIGCESSKFQGNFDSNGHMVSGLYISTTAPIQGLFGYTMSCTIKRLHVKGSVSGGGSTGGKFTLCPPSNPARRSWRCRHRGSKDLPSAPMRSWRSTAATAA